MTEAGDIELEPYNAQLLGPGRAADEEVEKRTSLQTAALWLVPTGLLLLVLVAFSSAGSRDAALSLMRLKSGGGSSSSALEEEALWVNDVPAEQLVDIVQSSHTCIQTESTVERVCNYKSLVIHRGILYYISDDASIDIPNVDAHYLGFGPEALLGPGMGLEVRSSAELPWGNQTRVKARVLDNVYLVYMKMGGNIGHALAEEVISMQNTLCKYLGSCTFEGRLGTRVVLLDQKKPQVAVAVNETVSRCLTQPPFLTMKMWASWEGSSEGIVVLRNVTAGMGPDCRAMAECHPQSSNQKRPPKRQQRMSQPAIGVWRRRLGDCWGFDAEEQASLRPLRVLVLDRLYESGRHFSNVYSIEKRIRELLPAAEVQVVYMEGRPAREQFLLAHSASILLMMHGAALGFWQFLPRKAVAIHVVPHPGSEGVQEWGKRMAEDLSVADITFVPVTNQRANLIRYHTDWLQRHEDWNKLNDTEKVALLEEGKCPDGFIYACLMAFTRKDADLEMDLDQLEGAMKQAVRDLLAKYPRSEVEGLGWAAELDWLGDQPA